MTLFEGSFAVALLAPVVAIAASIFLRGQRVFQWNSILLTLSGAAGMVAGAIGAIQDAPFTLPTPVFFGMTMALDKFSALFLVPLSIVVFCAGLYAISTSKREDATNRQLLGIMSGLLLVGMQWVLLAGNIVGFLAAWEIVGLSTLMLFVAHRSIIHLRLALRYFVFTQLGFALILIGYFLLSSGALFSDFGTLSYIAAQLEPRSIAIAFGFLLAGFGVASSLVPFHSINARITGHLPVHLAALVQSAVVMMGVYGFLRSLLFILPPLSIWYAVAVLIAGALSAIGGGILAMTEREPKHILSAVSTSGVGFTFFTMGIAMCLQTFGAFEAMNAALFAAILSVAVQAVAKCGLFLAVGARESQIRLRYVEIAALVLAVAAVGLPPLSLFVGNWMVGSTIVGALQSLTDVWYALVAVLLLVVFTLSVGLVTYALMRLFALTFFVSPKEEGPPVIADVWVLSSIFIPAALVIAIGFAAPRIFELIGAGPLTIAPGTWLGAIIAATGTLQLSIVALVIGGGVVLSWIVSKAFPRRPQETRILIEEEVIEVQEQNTVRDVVAARSIGIVLRGVWTDRCYLPAARVTHRVHAFARRGGEGSETNVALAFIVLALVLTLIFAL
ncbi:MAG: proton-conducting transporter membrane subunit [Patescibacteria group bacterium]